MLFDQLKTIIFTLGKPKKFPIYTRTWDPFCFLGYLSHRMDLFTYLPPFNTTTFIKPMNEEEEEAPHVRRNRLARERRDARSKEQRVVDASRRAAQRPTRSNVQIVLENATCVNAWTFLHPNRQQETHNTDCQARQGQREQLLEKRHQEICNVNHQACSAQCELDCANQGGNQVIPLARCEFDGSHCGLRHTLGEMTTVCGE
jgi:hypothetical protein